jgi:hypothetical protein
MTQPVRSAYQPPASSTFLSERISHQQPAATSQQYSSLRTNQHQPSATSQPNRPTKKGKFRRRYRQLRPFCVAREPTDGNKQNRAARRGNLEEKSPRRLIGDGGICNSFQPLLPRSEVKGCQHLSAKAPATARISGHFFYTQKRNCAKQ